MKKKKVNRTWICDCCNKKSNFLVNISDDSKVCLSCQQQLLSGYRKYV